MSLGTAAGTDIPIEHLDYGYIGNCNSSKEVEQILKVLRSGKEGHYPHLLTFTEKRLTELNPDSKLLIKSEKAKWLSDLSNEDSIDIANELKQWEEEMGSTDSKLKDKEKDHEDQDGLPPVRRSGNISGMAAAEDKSKKSTFESQRIKSADYRGWDRYDVEKEVEKLESEDKPEQHTKPASGSSTSMDSELTEKEKSMSLAEKQRSANHEREKGNEAFRSGDYQEALAYYTRSIKFCSTPAAHNNRAITEIKLELYPEAVTDCSQVLSFEPHNTKALFRRAIAYFNTKEYREAAGDYGQLLKLDPNNKKAQEQLNLLRKDFLDPEKKGRKVQIQEVEDETDTGSETTAKSTESVSNGPSSVGVASVPLPPPPIPSHIQKLKDEGNDLFRRGQYGEAMNKYTTAVNQLEKDDSHTVSLSTVLNNRAACHLKNGNSRGCLDDCTKSLSLVPINLKALIRRGKAYEAMEKYKHAYNDYQLALRIDHSVESAYTASSRIAGMLREHEGNDWRSKLPECHEATSVLAALSQERQALLAKSVPNDLDSDKNVGGNMEVSSDNPEASETSTKQSITGASMPGGLSSDKMSTASNRIETDGVASNQTNATPCTVPSDEGNAQIPSADDRPNPTDPTNQNESGTVEGVGGESGNESDDEGSEDDVRSGNSGESESETISEPVQQIPDIRPVNVTTTSTAIKDFSPHVTQSTQPVSTPFMTSKTPPEKRKEIPLEEKFEGYKTKGNEHVKMKEYVDALRYYSLCIEVCPDIVVGYTNRALCHLKLGSPRNAEEDCNKALSIEPGNIKALYRRGLARKDLERYADSAKDLKMLLDNDPNNTIASQKLAEVKQLWEKQLREIQAKASPSRKPRHHSASSTKKDKDKDKQKKVPNLAQTEKSLRETRAALENLLKEMKAKTNAAESTTAASGESGAKTGGVGGSESSSKPKKKTTTGSRTASSKSRNNKSTTPERSKTRTKPVDVSTGDKNVRSADMTATKTTYYEPKKDDKSSSTKGSSEGGVRKETKRKKIVIEEVDNNSESEEEVLSPSAATSSAASVQQSKAVETPSASSDHSKVTGENLAPYEFVQRWNSIPRTAQSIEYASLLEKIPPEKLPEVITNKLDGMMLTNIIRAIDKQFVPRKLYSLSTEILQNLCKVPRFGMNAMFLGPKEKLDLKNVFSALSEQQETPVPPSTLDSLKKEYGVES